MGLFDQFPYTNFHELNLDWILKALKELEHTIDQFVAINALKYADPIQWDITSQYEKNTIVIDPQTGTAYISVQPVPIGVALTNEDYWTVVFDLGSFVVRAAKNFANTYEEETTLTATVNTPAGGWLVWGETLYKANVNITAGDSYVEGGNITHFTLEDVIGHPEDLTTTDKSNLVAAINEVAAEVLGKIGDLADLDTTDKSNLVAAINEVVADIGAESQARETAEGDLTDLDTTDKSNLVAAINEILDTLNTTTGDLADLNTTDKSNLVAAINEVLEADISFDTAVSITGVSVGDIVITKGFYDIADGGGCTYIVTEDASNNLPTIQINGTYLMVLQEPVNVLSLGCKLDDADFDNATILNNAFSNYNSSLYCGSGNLYIKYPIDIPEQYKGHVKFNCSVIPGSGFTGSYLVNIRTFNNTMIDIAQILGNNFNGVGLLVGSPTMSYHVGNNTIKNTKIDRCTVGLKLSSALSYGTFNNHFYLTRIDNCDIGVLFEEEVGSPHNGFINQNQFYDLWVTGDGLNTKTAIKFTDNTGNHTADYNEDHFYNLSAEGCGTIVDADGIRECSFNNIRLVEQGPLDLRLFKLGSGCANNKFTSLAPYVDYRNVVDTGNNNIYDFNFYNRDTAQSLTSRATFKNGNFCVIGLCQTINVVNVSNAANYAIDPFKSAALINISLTANITSNVTLPNNFAVVRAMNPFFIKIGTNSGTINIKKVDGTLVASSDSTAGVPLLEADSLYYVVCNYDNSVVITKF